MSSLGRSVQHFKTLLHQGSDLMLLRLRLLALDLNAQAGGVVRIFAAIVFAAVMALLGLTSLLFGLNSVLTPTAKIWVFFGMAVLALATMAALLLWAVNTWQNRSNRVAETLRDMQQDLAYLSGRVGVAATEEETHEQKQQTRT